MRHTPVKHILDVFALGKSEAVGSNPTIGSARGVGRGYFLWNPKVAGSPRKRVRGRELLNRPQGRCPKGLPVSECSRATTQE
jgi:hypothetical protein